MRRKLRVKQPKQHAAKAGINEELLLEYRCRIATTPTPKHLQPLTQEEHKRTLAEIDKEPEPVKPKKQRGVFKVRFERWRIVREGTRWRIIGFWSQSDLCEDYTDIVQYMNGAIITKKQITTLGECAMSKAAALRVIKENSDMRFILQDFFDLKEYHADTV
jgi:hypothetical protein